MFALSILCDPYPQRRDWREISWLNRVGERLRVALLSRVKTTSRRLGRFVDQVDKAESELMNLSVSDRADALRSLRHDLRKSGFLDAAVARAFAMVRLHSSTILGLRHFSSQLQGGYVLLSGYVAEMDTGEGKSLTATLAAATAALAGWSVHVITVNDYLAQRDAEQMKPLYGALGLSTGLVLEGMGPDEKRMQYQANIVYCTSKTVVFDYLRDRVLLGDKMQPLALALDKLVASNESGVMLRGLQFAIVDEADSIFIDEARVPLIISASRPDTVMELFYQQAITLAKGLQTPAHFLMKQGGRIAALTDAGRQRLAESCRDLSGIWHGENRRDEVMGQALTALHAFERDIHYIVRDKKVMIVDENTGRVMPDRSWERGLQQLIEVKEALPLTPEKETLARISFQLFFRRYLRLSGMTGTCREVASEMADVYGVGMVRVQPYRPSRRRTLPTQLFATSEARWEAVITAVRSRHMAGQPVLVGTRSILASERLSSLLEAQGIPHRVLNAKQDEEEAEIVAHAGEEGRVTIATNMAGRGTDIRLSQKVLEKGGLHVILTERYDNARVDRQLAGRCARLGDPGSWVQICSLEDELVRKFIPAVGQTLRDWLEREPKSLVHRALGLTFYQWAQYQMECGNRKVRQGLLRTDFRTRQFLSFTGEME